MNSPVSGVVSKFGSGAQLNNTYIDQGMIISGESDPQSNKN